MSDVNAAYALPFEAQFHPEQAQQEYIYRVLRTVHTARLVRVLAVHPYPGGSGGTVDVQPLALNTDTNGAPLVEAPIFGMPWVRLQGGNSAFIVDPVVNDNGLAVFADRDSSNVIAQKAQAVVGSARAHSEMDGLYVGGVLNAAPTQWVKLSAAGIDINSPQAITLEAPTVTITSTGNTTLNAGALVINAPTTFNNTVQGTSGATGAYSFPDMQIGGQSVKHHNHGGVQPGSGNTSNWQ